MTRADRKALGDQLAVLAWLGAHERVDAICTTAELCSGLGTDKAVVWPACEALEKLGAVEWLAARRDSDRPGGWAITRAGRAMLDDAGETLLGGDRW